MTRPCDRVIRAALKRGEIKLSRGYRRQPRWTFGRRQFNSETINCAIDGGYAVRVGDVVRAS